MPELTRNQELMAQAIKNVKNVLAQPEGARKIYGGLCHKFPVLVRTCGLCQAVAFIESKRKDGERGIAHQKLTEHVSSVLSANDFTVNADPSESIACLSVRDYTRATRILLSAWIYYKRFAESILGVEAADQEVSK